MVDERTPPEPVNHYGEGRSNHLFLEALMAKKLWEIDKQKQFKDI